MGGFFNYDNPVWRFVGRIWDLFILNLLWVICSIPIVTFGASTTAMYYCTLKIAKDRDSGGMFTMFFHSFKDNIGQSTIIWIIMAFIGGILFFDIRFFSFYSPIQNTVIRMIIFTVTCFLILLWLFIFLYIFPIQAKFINSIKQTFKLALFMSIKHLVRTIIILAGSLIILIAVYYLIMKLPGVMSMLVLILGSGISLFQASQFNMVFDKYINEDNE
nr:YesL family protein [uncultured Lachnoanaerobaculum sp.]